MPLPPNTLPMMTGTGPFGPIEMGGMFTVVKVREDLAAGDYRDPGWYQHPQGTVAHEVSASTAGEPPRQRRSHAGEGRRRRWKTCRDAARPSPVAQVTVSGWTHHWDSMDDNVLGDDNNGTLSRACAIASFT